jgi:pimeloyl-ACP methyl ester carboxylesterase
VHSTFASLGAPGTSAVHHFDFGGSGTPLVMVHGLGGSALNWMAVGADFARTHRVYAIDLPGFGASEIGGWKDASVQSSAAVLLAFLDKVVGGPAILMGNSMGGLVSLLAANQAPARVLGLVLVDPSQPLRLGMPVDWSVTGRFATYALPYFGPRYMRRWAKEKGARGLVEEMLTLCTVDMKRINSKVIDAHVQHLHARLQSGTYTEAPFLQAARSLLALITRPARFEAATRTDVPTLLISGSHDRLVPLYLSRALAKSRKDWELEVFEDSGHVPMLEHPEAFVERVESWLARTLPQVRAPRSGSRGE